MTESPDFTVAVSVVRPIQDFERMMLRRILEVGLVETSGWHPSRTSRVIILRGMVETCPELQKGKINAAEQVVREMAGCFLSSWHWTKTSCEVWSSMLSDGGRLP